MSAIAAIPMRSIGPIKLKSQFIDEELYVPLATFEAPLWPSTQRGAKVTQAAGGIQVTLVDERMTRSILLEAPNAALAQELIQALPEYRQDMDAIVAQGSRYARLLDIHTQMVGNLLYLRFEFSTGDAAGHNMTTQAAEQLLSWLLAKYAWLRYQSISANYCTDKKASAVNGILGRGKNVIAETTISPSLCQQYLRSTPQQIAELNTKKNLIGTLLAGGIRSANAHFANMLLAFYLATGQDAANIVEGSQGITFAEVRDDNLYFSVTLPNIIVGTVGNGKELAFVQENLRALGCLEKREVGANARRLAMIAAATVLCGELSLLAAQTNPGELMHSHLILERQAKRGR
jgi:hydroxymethylglutaryl-CoA reductase (NADPH)